VDLGSGCQLVRQIVIGSSALREGASSPTSRKSKSCATPRSAGARAYHHAGYKARSVETTLQSGHGGPPTQPRKCRASPHGLRKAQATPGPRLRI